MDTMKFLLGATIALLLGAVAISWNGMKKDEANTPPDEIARLKKQVEEIRREQDRLQMEKQMQQLRTAEPITPAPAPISNSERDAMKAELAAKEAQLQEIQDAKEKADKKAKVLDQENLEFGKRDIEKSDSELRRARMVSDALLIGKVTEYAEDPNLGNIVVFQVLMPANVQTGTVLGIRRKTGIIGQIKVSQVTPEGAIASPLGGFGQFKPEVGDELILPPEY